MLEPPTNHLFEFCKTGRTEELMDALKDLDETNVIDERGYSLLCVALKNAQWEIARALVSNEKTTSPVKPVIITACQCVIDDTTGIDLILEYQSNLNQQNDRGRTALMTACLLGHINKVDKLISQGASVDLQDIEGNTALIEAVNSKNKFVLEKLLKLNPKVNHTNHNLETALIIAVQQKTPVEDMIKQLLENGADPELLDAEKKSAWLIAKQKHSKISKLIEKHLNTINQIELPFFTNNYSVPEHKEEPQTNAVNESSKPILIEKPIEKQKTGTVAETETEAEAEIKSETETETVIIKEPKPQKQFIFNKPKNMKTNKQEWFHAAKIGNLGGLNRMIIEGIGIDCLDNKGCTALIRACGHSKRAVVSFLLQQNADIEIRSNNGSTALSSSIIGNCRRVAGLLLDKKANPNGIGPSDYSYATIAAAQWNDAMLSILYRNKANIFIENKQQQNLLHIVALAAEYYNNISQAKMTMQFLLDHGINIDAQDIDGNTALMLMCGAHKEKFKVEDRNIASLVHSIIKLGASVAITNKQGKSALEAASYNKLQQTKGVLMNALSWNTR